MNLAVQQLKVRPAVANDHAVRAKSLENQAEAVYQQRNAAQQALIDVVLRRLAFKDPNNGQYSQQRRLPTCEELAAELGVNKNTINKAYRSLVGRGFLRTIQGRGTFVVKETDESARLGQRQRVQEQVHRRVLVAMGL